MQASRLPIDLFFSSMVLFRVYFSSFSLSSDSVFKLASSYIKFVIFSAWIAQSIFIYKFSSVCVKFLFSFAFNKMFSSIYYVLVEFVSYYYYCYDDAEFYFNLQISSLHVYTVWLSVSTCLSKFSFAVSNETWEALLWLWFAII